MALLAGLIGGGAKVLGIGSGKGFMKGGIFSLFNRNKASNPAPTPAPASVPPSLGFQQANSAQRIPVGGGITFGEQTKNTFLLPVVAIGALVLILLFMGKKK